MQYHPVRFRGIAVLINADSECSTLQDADGTKVSVMTSSDTRLLCTLIRRWRRRFFSISYRINYY